MVMQEKSTSHVFWFFVTVIAFFLGGPILAFFGGVGWLCAVGRTRKHNAQVQAQRHFELLLHSRQHH